MQSGRKAASATGAWLAARWNAVRAGPRRRLVLAAAVLLALLLSAGTAGWMALAPRKLDVWKAATHPYDPSCKAGCEVWREVAAGHGGGPDQSLSFVYDPKVDDAVAQWGDCLKSVLTCAQTRQAKTAGPLNACVGEAQCPQPCKDRFSRRTSPTDDDAAWNAFYAVFVNEDAVCRPEDRRG